MEELQSIVGDYWVYQIPDGHHSQLAAGFKNSLHKYKPTREAGLGLTQSAFSTRPVAAAFVKPNTVGKTLNTNGGGIDLICTFLHKPSRFDHELTPSTAYLGINSILQIYQLQGLGNPKSGVSILTTNIPTIVHGNNPVYIPDIFVFNGLDERDQLQIHVWVRRSADDQLRARTGSPPIDRRSDGQITALTNAYTD